MKLNKYLFQYKIMSCQECIIKVWEKVSNDIKKLFDNELVQNDKYLKAKIKSYEGKTNTNFRDDKMPKTGSRCFCLSVILTNSVYRTAKKYYHQVFLEECKYIVIKKMLVHLLTTQKFIMMILMSNFLMKNILMK